MSVLNWVLTVVLVIGALSGWIFIVIYTRRTAWWDDEHRTHLALFTLALTLIMTLYVFRPFIEPVTFAIMRAPLFVAVVACMVWRVALLIRSGRRRRRPTEVRSSLTRGKR